MFDESARFGAELMQPGLNAMDSEENTLRPKCLEDLIRVFKDHPVGIQAEFPGNNGKILIGGALKGNTDQKQNGQDIAKAQEDKEDMQADLAPGAFSLV